MTIEELFNNRCCFDNTNCFIYGKHKIDEVVKIKLRDKNLISVPSFLNEFLNLKILDLGNNKITIIEHLEGLNNLENLYLNNNKIEIIKNLPLNIKILKLNKNPLKYSEISKEEFKNLKKFYHSKTMTELNNHYKYEILKFSKLINNKEEINFGF